MKTLHKIAAVVGLLSGLAFAAQAQGLRIGSWLSASIPPTPANDEGWDRGQGGFGPNGSIFSAANSPSAFDVYAGVAAGYAQSLVIHETGYGNVRLYISLTPAQIAALTNSSQLSFTLSVPPGDAGTPSGYLQQVDFQYNSDPSGWHNGTPATAHGWSETGDTNNDSNGQPIFYYSTTSPARQQVVTWNYKTAGVNFAGATYAQFVWVFQSSGGELTNIYMNNVTLGTPPTEIDYIVDDFSTNGVNSSNPTNYDYYPSAESYAAGNITSVWGEWFGTRVTVSFDPNVNVSGDTNANGAMAINMTWDAASDGYQQFVVYQQGFGTLYVPGGTVGIGYPQYTNLECDVMFDPSSAGTTNANGVLGVIRLGIRPVSGGQDWINSSYTTISDTNWHHITAQFPNNNAAFTDIGGVLIGEDVTAYVGGGGLTGNQILYVDNVKFTGPLATQIIPPPTLAVPQPAKPGLRIFAGSTANTYDREELYTTDSSQSWVDPSVTYPVEYSYSLQNYNSNIGQIHLELIPGSSGSQYSDWNALNMLWMQLNPGPAAGQVVCNVQWKTNASGSNPGGTGNPYGNALSFTNSTAVGTWTLVFTSTNTGYVIPPGQVILGPTNFTITDTNLMADFADPMYCVFGHQPNSVAGEGAYIDYGMIKVTGVAGVNEFEDFTAEGSDISANLTPSGEFNNSASAMTASTIIVTTNDTPGGWWIEWSQPAANFTLASSTNLMSANWINPGWYSGYSDTNAPRIMPLATPFGQNFWVLLPKDDVPTANGLQNPAPPAAGPPAPTAFFLLSTNVVSP
jgi:hypothetical protein